MALPPQPTLQLHPSCTLDPHTCPPSSAPEATTATATDAEDDDGFDDFDLAALIEQEVEVAPTPPTHVSIRTSHDKAAAKPLGKAAGKKRASEPHTAPTKPKKAKKESSKPAPASSKPPSTLAARGRARSPPSEGPLAMLSAEIDMLGLGKKALPDFLRNPRATPAPAQGTAAAPHSQPRPAPSLLTALDRLASRGGSRPGDSGTGTGASTGGSMDTGAAGQSFLGAQRRA